MKKDFFSAFGEAAERKLPLLMASGRHLFHEKAIPAIVEDIVHKLCPSPDDRLLEIGCGAGLLLKPLAALVREAVGIDNRYLLHEFVAQDRPPNVELIAGRFPEVRPDGSFKLILVYSTLQYVTCDDEATVFVNACLQLLAPSGRLLIGDLPNADAAQRFFNSIEGPRATEDYMLAKVGDQESNPRAYAEWADIEQGVVRASRFINDSFLLALLADLRRRSYESYLLPQPRELPFSLTREDLLVRYRS